MFFWKRKAVDSVERIAEKAMARKRAEMTSSLVAKVGEVSERARKTALHAIAIADRMRSLEKAAGWEYKPNKKGKWRHKRVK